MADTERPEGYYWVRQKPFLDRPAEQELARWSGGEWCLCGLAESFSEDDLSEIGDLAFPVP